MKEIDPYRRSELYTDKYGIEDQIAEGDKIATRWTYLGTNTGRFSSQPCMRELNQAVLSEQKQGFDCS